MANAQDLISIRWASMVILCIPARSHLNNKTRPGLCKCSRPLFGARVKVNKARRAIHTKADNSCFCYPSQQFHETWCDQIKNKDVLENCAPAAYESFPEAYGVFGAGRGAAYFLLIVSCGIKLDSKCMCINDHCMRIVSKGI